MNEQQILDAVRELAMSQGFYGRLLQSLQEDHDALVYLAAQKFGDVLDMILFLES